MSLRGALAQAAQAVTPSLGHTPAGAPLQQHARGPGAMDEALATSWANYTAAECLALPAADSVACSAQQLNITAPPRHGSCCCAAQAVVPAS